VRQLEPRPCRGQHSFECTGPVWRYATYDADGRDAILQSVATGQRVRGSARNPHDREALPTQFPSQLCHIVGPIEQRSPMLWRRSPVTRHKINIGYDEHGWIGGTEQADPGAPWQNRMG